MSHDPWPRIAVLGAGAVGSYFGGLLARAGAPVTFIGRALHVDALRRDGLLLETRHFRERVAVAASTDAAEAAGAEIVLLCVKSGDTEAAARAVAPHLSQGATVVSLQNGVDNATRVRALVDAEVIAAVVYVGCQMAGPGHVRHTGRGELVVGGRSGSRAGARRAEAVAALFERAGVPCEASARVDDELWRKLLINCAYNALSALTRLRYAPMVASPWARVLMSEVVGEGVAVAHAEGVALDPNDLLERVWSIADSMPEQISSTAQDLQLGRPTEIDALNGFVARRGAAHGLPVPANRALHALVKLLELTTPSPTPRSHFDR